MWEDSNWSLPTTALDRCVECIYRIATSYGSIIMAKGSSNTSPSESLLLKILKARSLAKLTHKRYFTQGI
jgi:hypothetical protein